MDINYIYLMLACLLGLAMTWGVGANDLANVMSTTMGSKAVTVRKALIIAVIFEFMGAFLGGSEVTDTIRNKIINIELLANEPEILILGMLSVLVASMAWINFASYLGFPVSITNAIVGSVVGFGVIVLGSNTIHWDQVGYIATSWISSPTLAGIFAYILIIHIQRFIFARKDPLKHAKRFVPYYLFLIGLVLSFITVIKGLEHFGIHFMPMMQLFIAVGCGILITVLGLMIINQIPKSLKLKRHETFTYIEKIFAILMAFTACAMVFAHGSNDVSVAVGPIALIMSIVTNGGDVASTPTFPAWLTLLGVSGVLIGFLMYGRKVIETVGSGITALTPSRAFAATLAAATAVVISTSTGIPVSTTQTLVGAVLGVGLARGIGALNLVVIRNIFMSWIITLPIASLITIGCFHLLKFFFLNHS
ncbi:MAG: inorganic phosphate transporter [Proteobacteria bacterium]|nr:inorganic phosphate transporter [Pseudomonadota bacterium]